MATRVRRVEPASPFAELFAAAWPASRVLAHLFSATGSRVKSTQARRDAVLSAVWHVLLGHWAPRGARPLPARVRDALARVPFPPSERAMVRALDVRVGDRVPAAIGAYAVLATMLYIMDAMTVTAVDGAVPPEIYARASWTALHEAVCAADPLDPFPVRSASTSGGLQRTPIGAALVGVPRTFDPMHWLGVTRSKHMRARGAAEADAATVVRMGCIVATALQEAHRVVAALDHHDPDAPPNQHTVALLVGMCTAAARVRGVDPCPLSVANAYAQVVRSGSGQRRNPVAVLRALDKTHPLAVTALLETAALASEAVRVALYPLPSHVTRRQVVGLVVRYGALLNRRVSESLMCSRCKQPHSVTLPAPAAVSRKPAAPPGAQSKQPRPRARRRRAARDQEECYHALLYDVFTGTVSCAEYKSTPTTTMPSATAAVRKPPALYPLPLLGTVVVLNNAAALSLCVACGAHTYLDIAGRGYDTPVCRKCVDAYGDDHLASLCIPPVTE